MKIRGFLSISLLDFPGKICTLVYTQGCNWRCPFCYNYDLIPPTAEEEISEDVLFEAINRRKKLIEGVAITGGEPLFWEDSPQFLSRLWENVRLPIKLDTNGSYPERLAEALNSVEGLEYVAMDVKGTPEDYPRCTGGKGSHTEVVKSFQVLKEWGKPFEIRITVVPNHITPGNIAAVAEPFAGAPTAVLQQFVNTRTLSPSYRGVPPYHPDDIKAMAEKIRPLFGEVLIRGI